MDDNNLVGIDLGTSATKVRFTSLRPLRWLKRVLIYLPIIQKPVLFNRKFLIPAALTVCKKLSTTKYIQAGRQQ